MFDFKPDYDRSIVRYNAFWEREIADRPLVSITFPNLNRKVIGDKTYKSNREKWLDFDYRIEKEIERLENTCFYADSMPIIWPNLGPEIISAFCGCGYEFGDSTTWSTPCIEDWEKDYGKAVFDRDNEYFKLLDQFTAKLIQAGKGKFIVGFTDMHGGGDHIAALRDPQNLCFDMIENVDYVKRKLDDSYKEYFEIYDYFYDLLSSNGFPGTTWLQLLAEKGKYSVVSNDFSCMISKKMFDDIFLPGIMEECRYFDKTIYHLDGPGALQHLDSLLEINELDAIQWVCGAGNEGFQRWAHVYRKIQEHKKGMQVIVDVTELDSVFENLKPQGVWLCLSGINNKEEADHALNRVISWK